MSSAKDKRKICVKSRIYVQQTDKNIPMGGLKKTGSGPPLLRGFCGHPHWGVREEGRQGALQEGQSWTHKGRLCYYNFQNNLSSFLAVLFLYFMCPSCFLAYVCEFKIVFNICMLQRCVSVHLVYRFVQLFLSIYCMCPTVSQHLFVQALPLHLWPSCFKDLRALFLSIFIFKLFLFD